MNLGWALRRLGAMSGSEIRYRVGQQMHASIERLGWRKSQPEAPLAAQLGAGWCEDFPRDFGAARYRRAADDILAGRFNIFAMRAAQLGFPPDWNRDPKTGVRAPLSFGKSINYRDERLVGDIKYLWEPSRHRELITLAQAWRLTGRTQYAQGCRVLLESWFEQCPHPLGVHWTSSLEHAMRLIHWSFAWRLLGGYNAEVFRGEPGARFRARWLDNVYLHPQFIANHFSRFSSANNHLLGELTGLFIAQVTWPFWRMSEKLRDQAQAELEREALLQNGADGVNREQATWYHHEVADLMMLAGLAARACGRDFSAAYWSRWRAMLEYIASVMDVSGRVPNIGDADDAVIAPLDPSPHFDPYKSLLAAGAVLFDDARLKFKAGALDDKTRWLLGARAERFHALRADPAELPFHRQFAEAGNYILGHRFETPEEIRLVADAGSLGFLSIAAHGHADALSFTLSAGGRDVLIDPGTYAYHTQRRWRDYYRGTSAHNTVRIDQQDQSVSGGTFLWRTHARTQVLAFESSGAEQRLVAEHDGYRRLQDPVRCRREWIFDSRVNRLTITDEIACARSHDVEQFWHLSEFSVIEREADAVVVTDRGVRLVIRFAPGMQIDMHRGEESPTLGWVSRAFDQHTPASTIRCSARISGATRFVTVIDVEVQTETRTERAAAEAHGGALSTLS